jgi:hypothetical protein
MNELLDRIVPPFDEPTDWDDVLRRARTRRAPRRLVLVAAVVGAALVVGPALGVLLTRHTTPRLPAGADKRNVVVIVQPLTGRILVQAAPWKGHDGICYVMLFQRAGCVPRTLHGTLVLTPPITGYTFDSRVVSGTARTLAGKRVPLQIEHFPKLKVTFFLRRGRLPGLFREITLRDAAGRVVVRQVLKR